MSYEFTLFDECQSISQEVWDKMAEAEMPEDTRVAHASSDGFWDDAEVISRYTRAQALDDGVLVDVSEMAHEAGFVIPVAVTQAVWSDVNDIPPSQSHQDVNGRLWDLLYMSFLRARVAPKGTDEMYTRFIMHQGRKTYYTVKLQIGPGDNAEPVITIMRPEED